MTPLFACGLFSPHIHVRSSCPPSLPSLITCVVTCEFISGVSDVCICYFLCWQVQSEVNFLGRLSHPNLVRLLGYCGEDRELLLVYEFMSKGSLENHLFRSTACLPPSALAVRLIGISTFQHIQIGKPCRSTQITSIRFDELQW